MAKTVCPKCGFEQDGGAECQRCGIVFARYRSHEEALRQPATPFDASVNETPGSGMFRRVYRVLRWVALIGTILTVVLILRPSPPPSIPADPMAKERVESKVRQHKLEAQAGRAHTLELDQSEVNAWMNSNLSLAPRPKPVDKRADPPQDATSEEPTLREVQSTVRDVKVELLDARIRAYVLFDFHGKDLSLVLEGRPVVEAGYLRFQPTSAKLGSLPLPQATLQSAVERLFESPENKEKFRLPPEIKDIWIESGELKISYR